MLLHTHGGKNTSSLCTNGISHLSLLQGADCTLAFDPHVHYLLMSEHQQASKQWKGL